RRKNRFFQLRKHRRHPPRGRRRLARNSFSSRARLRFLRNSHSRPHARQRERPPTGGARHHRRQSDLRHLLPSSRARGAHPFPPGQPHLGTRRSRHDPLFRSGVFKSRQPPHGL